MKHVLLIAPYFGPTMRTCLEAFTKLEDGRAAARPPRVCTSHGHCAAAGPQPNPAGL